MGFKDQAEKDLGTFVNIDEFAGVHLVNGKSIPIVIDGDETKGRPRQPIDLYHSAAGIFIGQITVFARASDFEDRPVPGQRIEIDDKLYLVSSCTDSLGLLMIVLEANEA